MRRIVILLLLVSTTCIFSNAQSVLGIPFGSSYQKTKEYLENRFGKYNVFEEGGRISIFKPVIGGYEFDTSDFYFQRQGTNTWLNQVVIQSWFDVSDVSSARYLRDALANNLREKYLVEEHTDREGFKYYGFGTDPKNENNYLGTLNLSKSKGKDGKQRLYVILNYGPIYYIDRSSDF